MSAYDDIYSLSTENHGIVTTRDARGLGVRTKDIARWVKMGRLIKVGFGVYRTSQYPMSEEDPRRLFGGFDIIQHHERPEGSV